MKRHKILLIAILASWAQMKSQTSASEPLQLSLQDAVSYALDSSFQTQAAKQDIYYAQKQIWEATAIGLPQINAGAGYNYNIKIRESAVDVSKFPGVPSGTPADIQYLAFGLKNDMDGHITASQLIFDGAYFVGLQSARTVAKISELSKEKSDILVKEAVANGYVAVLVSEESIRILDRNIASVKSNIKEVRAMYDNGLMEEQDVEQLELTLSSLENSMNQNKRLAKINAEMLKFTMGMDIGKPIELTDNIDKVLLSNYEVTALDEVLKVEDHIDYQIAENDLKTKDLLIRYEKTKYMPNISAFFNAGYVSYSDIFDFFEFNDSWRPYSTVGLTLNIPIFSSLQRRAKVDMAKIDYEKSRIQQEQLVQNLFRELHVAQDAYAYSIDNYRTNEKNMQLAENIERKESIKYQEGISTSLDLTNAQNQLYGSQQNFMNAILLVVQSKIALDKALNKL